MIYIFDLDGTLADITHRLHFIKNGSNNWREFFAACSNDMPIDSVCYLARTLYESGARIIIVTGRSDECEEATLDWLQKYKLPPSPVYMRKEGDHRPDHEVKAELLNQVIEDWLEDGPIAGIFEDRKQVVDMYRARGLRVFQVADGDF